MNNTDELEKYLMLKRHRYTDDEVMELLSSYDDRFSYLKLGELTMRDVEDIRLIYSDMTYKASLAYEQNIDFNSVPIVCIETQEKYKNYKTLRRRIERTKTIIIGACLYGYAIMDKHYCFDMESYGK